MAYIGQPTRRVDGRAKVTGAREVRRRVHVAGPRLRLRRVQRRWPGGGSRASTPAEALRLPGVLAVLTHENAPRCLARRRLPRRGRAARARRSARSTTTRSSSATSRSRSSWPTASSWRAMRRRWCGSSTRPQRATSPTSIAQREAGRRPPDEQPPTEAARRRRRRRSPRPPARVDAEYRHARSSTTTRWSRSRRPRCGTSDGTLTVYDKTQGVQNVQRLPLQRVRLAPDEMRVCRRFVGGGFGCGLRPQYQVVPGRAGGAELKRSVRVS